MEIKEKTYLVIKTIVPSSRSDINIFERARLLRKSTPEVHSSTRTTAMWKN